MPAYPVSISQIFLKESKILKLEISGNTLTSGSYLGFPAIPAKFGVNIGEKYAIWIGFQRKSAKL